MIDTQSLITFAVGIISSSGLVSWFFKSIIERHIKRVDTLELAVNDILRNNAAILVHISEIRGLRQDVKDTTEKLVKLELTLAETIKDVDAAHQKLRKLE